MPTRRSLLATLAATALAGCSFDAGSGERQPETTVTGATPPGGSRHWHTHPQPSGNRLLPGAGNARSAEAVRFEPAGRPEWLVAHPATEGSHWTVVADDGALAADFDGDGRTELLAPTSDRRTLVAVRRTRDGAEIAWRRPLDSPVRSNLAGVALADGVAVGVGAGETVTV